MNMVTASPQLVLATNRCWKKLWSLKLPRKIIIFAWRVLNSAIHTNFYLSHRGVNFNIFCTQCDMHAREDVNHVFLGVGRRKRYGKIWRL